MVRRMVVIVEVLMGMIRHWGDAVSSGNHARSSTRAPCSKRRTELFERPSPTAIPGRGQTSTVSTLIAMLLMSFVVSSAIFALVVIQASETPADAGIDRTETRHPARHATAPYLQILCMILSAFPFHGHSFQLAGAYGPEKSRTTTCASLRAWFSSRIFGRRVRRTMHVGSRAQESVFYPLWASATVL